jgi:hypothetical protein
VRRFEEDARQRNICIIDYEWAWQSIQVKSRLPEDDFLADMTTVSKPYPETGQPPLDTKASITKRKTVEMEPATLANIFTRHEVMFNRGKSYQDVAAFLERRVSEVASEIDGSTRRALRTSGGCC